MEKEYPLKDFNSLRRQMEEKWEIPPDFDPQMWLLCSERAERLTESKDYDELSKLYSHMAEFLQKEGRPSHCVREEACKALLLHIRRDPRVSSVEIVCAENACPACLEHEGRTFLLEDALAAMPLPNRHCSFKQPAAGSAAACRCSYRPLA
jgi:hypothetical protein